MNASKSAPRPTRAPVTPLDDAARERGRRNAVLARQQRAKIKAQLRDGEMTVAEVLEHRTDPVLHRLRLRDILTSLPGIGQARAALIAELSEIEPDRRLGHIGEHQSRRLVEVLVMQGRPDQAVSQIAHPS